MRRHMEKDKMLQNVCSEDSDGSQKNDIAGKYCL